MGQLLHPTATTTHRIRKEIQESGLSNGALARKFGINKTVKKWRDRKGEGPETVRAILAASTTPWTNWKNRRPAISANSPAFAKTHKTHPGIFLRNPDHQKLGLNT